MAISDYLWLCLGISGYLRVSQSSIKYQGASKGRIESMLLVFETFPFFLFIADASYKGARAPKKVGHPPFIKQIPIIFLNLPF